MCINSIYNQSWYTWFIGRDYENKEGQEDKEGQEGGDNDETPNWRHSNPIQVYFLF